MSVFGYSLRTRLCTRHWGRLRPTAARRSRCRSFDRLCVSVCVASARVVCLFLLSSAYVGSSNSGKLHMPHPPDVFLLSFGEETWPTALTIQPGDNDGKNQHTTHRSHQRHAEMFALPQMDVPDVGIFVEIATVSTKKMRNQCRNRFYYHFQRILSRKMLFLL